MCCRSVGVNILHSVLSKILSFGEFSFHSIRSFQNGRHSPSTRSTSASRLAGKMDLKGAYFVIPIWKEQRKYLRFVWKSTLPEFAFLPFGLATAPRLFTKVMKPIVALLCQVGIRLIIYLDDLLFMNQSKEGLLLDLTTARYLLENLRFVINLEKSCFTPTQTVDNTRDMILLLADYKVDAIKVDCYNLRCESESYLR